MGASIALGSARTFRLIRRETSLRRSGRPSDVSFYAESLCRSRPAFYVHAVIERYSRAPMRELWSEQRKFEIWLEIETLACEAMAEIGQIPPADAAEIRQRARFSIPEINEIEKRTNHDVIAFLENVATSVGPAARWIHQGLTSSDILDTTLAVQLVAAGKILLEDIRELRRVVADQARRYKMTPMIGRSHGIHAEPITFGLKLALMFDEFGRAEERLTQTLGRVGVGKLSGSVGTHAHLDPRIERHVCEKLGLQPAKLSTQIIQRDRHAEFCTTLALIASSIDRWATELRHLQRTEVLEVEEFFGAGQKGSSSMPHKRNPITAERLSGLARVVRGTPSRRSRTSRSGTNATSATRAPSASSCRIRACCSITCSRNCAT